MPVYEYQCDDCKKVFDNLQGLNAPLLTECKFCKGPIKKLISNCAAIYKGQGFHCIDYPSSSRKWGEEKEKCRIINSGGDPEGKL